MSRSSSPSTDDNDSSDNGASNATRDGINLAARSPERRAIAAAVAVAERALMAGRPRYLAGRGFDGDRSSGGGIGDNFDGRDYSDEDEGDNDEEDDEDLLTQELDHDPFNVDQKKMLHFPGAMITRGRNIANILADRAFFGAHFTRHVEPTPWQQQQQQRWRDAYPTAADPPSSDESEASNKTERAVSPNAFAAATAPAGFHSPHPTQSSSSHPLRSLTSPPTLPPSNPPSYLSPPHRHSSSNVSSYSTQSPRPRFEPDSDSAGVASNRADATHPVPESITSEIRSFAEYCTSVRFRASYLCHLSGPASAPILPPRPSTVRSYSPSGGSARPGRGEDAPLPSEERPPPPPSPPAGETLLRRLQREQREMQRRQQHQQRRHRSRDAHPHVLPGRRHGLIHPRGFAARPPSDRPPNRSDIDRGIRNNVHDTRRNNSVSTISLSFSPDGRTLASTHGDHTVKITCCHTGKLVRELVGHPRTPWTVKYHPTNSRIVASGCLGYQVRIWDWNSQPEGVRKERRRERRRKWYGRYHLEERGGTNGGWDKGCGEEAFAGGCSPRGVVDQVMRRQSEEDSAEEMGKWASRDVVEHLLPREEEDDDYAAFVLAASGIPSEDPAWYDCESDSYNYDEGKGVCLYMIRLNHAIISLSFHPSGDILAIASGNNLHLWDYDEERRKKRESGLSDNHDASDHGNGTTNARPMAPSQPSRASNADGQQPVFPRGGTMDFRHETALRCVHFPPGGDSLIVGGVNPHRHNEGLPGYRSDPRARGGMSGGGMSFYLRLWSFDLDAVMNSSEDIFVMGGRVERVQRGGRISDVGEISWDFRLAKDALWNPRIIIPRVLLYNDGGFDVSQDGKMLSACAEYWLPDGINNAMELLLSQQEYDDESSSDNEDSNRSSNKSPPVGGSRKDDASMMSSPPFNSGLPPNFPDPRTPPPNANYTSLEPPSPPGKRNIPHGYVNSAADGTVHYGGMAMPPRHHPHPLSVVAADHPSYESGGGRYVPHIVTVSMDTSPPVDGVVQINDVNIHATEGMRNHPKLGQLLMAAPLDGTKASGVTCVKLSPTGEYCLLGYGVRESVLSADGNEEIRHPVTALYNVKKGMKQVCTLLSPDDDVNIARFHPETGHGFVYGTKQGRVRVLATRPWNQYQNLEQSLT